VRRPTGSPRSPLSVLCFTRAPRCPGPRRFDAPGACSDGYFMFRPSEDHVIFRSNLVSWTIYRKPP
jgi:hypothetical protein